MQCDTDFMNSPTLDAIRAIILQNHHHLYMSSGDLGGSALVLTSTALSLAREMGLVSKSRLWHVHRIIQMLMMSPCRTRTAA